MASDQLDEDLIPKEPLPPFRPKVIWICLISACAGTLLVWQEIPAGNMLLFPTLGLMSGYSIKTRYRDGKNIVLRNLALLIGLFGFAYMIYSVTANDGDPIGWEGPVSFAAILLAYFLFSGKTVIFDNTKPTIMTRKNLNLIPTIGLLAVTLLMSCSQDAESGAAKSDDKSARAEKQPREVSELTCLDELHERKNFNSYDRSIKDYLKSKPNLPTGEKHVVYLLPFGNMKPQVEEIIQAEVDYLSTFLQMEVRVMERLSYDQIKGMTAVKTRMVPDGDYVRYGKMKGEQYVRRNLREQIEANSFIEHYVTPNMPKDAIAVLGVTEHDIYKPNYNYLFGTSKIKGGVGLVSTFRLVDYGQETRDNIRKVMSKQIVNMFSIRNVEDYECLLNFHRNKAELEDGLFQLSPIALEKLGHALGFNHEQRFSELEKLWEEEGYTWMADYYIRGRELLAQTEKEQNKTDAKDHP